MKSLHALVALLVALFAAHPASAAADGIWRAGAYSFSDELGGFRILSVEGAGTKGDPVVVTQEFLSASPVTLVIRIHGPIRPYANDPAFATGFLNLVVVARNASQLAWTEFEFELQEKRGVPSVYGDGLSFDQRRQESDNIRSVGFEEFDRAFEPYDRLLFTHGFVDPGAEARFVFVVSDLTPKRTFYLVQDPRIPSS